MKRHTTPDLPIFMLLLTPFALVSTNPQDVIVDEDFLNPPLAARPGAFWPWLNGDVSLERITYELQEMKKKGMAG